MAKIACPKCKSVMTFAEEARGTTVECTQCQQRLRIPAAAAPRAVAPNGPLVVSPPAPPPESPPPPPEPPLRSAAPAKASLSPSPDIDDEDEDAEGPAATGPKAHPSAVANVFGGLSALVLLAGFLILISGRWVKWIGDPVQKFLEAQGIPPAVAIAGTAVILLIPLGLLLASMQKSGVVNAMPDDVDFRDTKPSDHSDLDTKRLAEYTEELEALGFRQVTDYTALTNLGNGISGFARLFYNDEKRCYAEVNQAFRHQSAAGPVRCSIMSFLDDGWSVSVGDRPPTKELYLIRRPRALWRSLSGRPPADLVGAHLKLRDEVSRGLGVEPVSGGDAKSYFRREMEATRERKDRVRRRNAVVMAAELWLFERSPKSEWLGDYPRARKRG